MCRYNVQYWYFKLWIKHFYVEVMTCKSLCVREMANAKKRKNGRYAAVPGGQRWQPVAKELMGTQGKCFTWDVSRCDSCPPWWFPVINIITSCWGELTKVSDPLHCVKTCCAQKEYALVTGSGWILGGQKYKCFSPSFHFSPFVVSNHSLEKRSTEEMTEMTAFSMSGRRLRFVMT